MLADPPLTKRQLGWLILGAGGLLTLAGLGIDLVTVGHFKEFGPAQQQAVGGGLLLLIFGLSLLPGGKRPA